MNNENQILSSPELNQVLPSGLLSPMDLLKNAWAIYKKNWRLLTGIMLVPMLLVYLSGFVMVGGGLVGLMFAIANPSIANITGMMLISAILLLVIIVIQIWGQMSVIYALIHHHEPQNVWAVFKQTRHYIWPYLWISILMGLAILGGLVIFVIPGIVLSVLFVFASLSLINENKKGLKALSASREYFRGQAWPVVLRLAVILILSLITSAIVSSLFGDDRGGGLASLVLTLFLAPFVMTYMFVLYENIKATVGEKRESDLKTNYISVFAGIGLVGILVILGSLVFGFSLIDKSKVLSDLQGELEKELGEDVLKDLPDLDLNSVE